jgi:hypothetical protein
MNTFSGIFSVAAAASLISLSLFSCQALAAPGEIRPGHYAPITTDYDTVFHNRYSFSCAGKDAGYCGALLERGRLSREEKQMAKGAPVSGDLRIERDRRGDYSVSGAIYVARGCEIASGFYSPKIHDERYYEFESESCLADANGFIHCEFVDPTNPMTDDKIILSIRRDRDHSIRIATRISGSGEDFNPGCIREIEKYPFHYEHGDEFAHNMYVTAKLDYMRADADLNSVWDSLERGYRKSILPEQRQWIKRKESKCGSVTMRGNEISLTKMYRCQTLMTEQRTYELKYGD